MLANCGKAHKLCCLALQESVLVFASIYLGSSCSCLEGVLQSFPGPWVNENWFNGNMRRNRM